MNFNKHDVTGMHAELDTVPKRVHKLILVREVTASHRLDGMNHLRLLGSLQSGGKTIVSTGSRYRVRSSTRPRGICVR